MNKKAFTLIELMISISIIVLLTIVVYAPYNFYANKARLKIAWKEIAQTIYEARNMAIYWLTNSYTWSNSSIWVYFDNSSLNKNKISVYSYKYDYSWKKDDFSDPSVKLLKEVSLQKWIQIDNVEWKDKFLFFFQAISGSWSFYYDDSWNLKDFAWKEIKINLSYKWATQNILKNTVTYYTNTNIIDYK